VKASPITDDADPPPTAMKLDRAPVKSYTDIGGSESQIQEVQESVESHLLYALLSPGSTPVSDNVATEVDSIGNQQVPGSSGYEDQTEFNTELSVDWLDDMNHLYIGSVNLCSPKWKIHFLREGVHDETFCGIQAAQVNSLLWSMNRLV
jgi:hypothetical protein